MRSALPYYVIGFVVLIALLIIFGPRLSQGSVTGLVNEVVGQAEIKAKGNSAWRPLQLGESLVTGNAVRTGEASQLNIRWSEGTHLRLGEKSEVLVKHTHINYVSRKAELQLKQVSGISWLRLLKDPKMLPDVEITCNDVTYKFGHSSIFSVQRLSDEENRLEVLEGHCEVIKGQDRVIVESPKVAIYKKGEALAAGQTMPDKEQEAWQQNTQIVDAFINVVKPQEGEQLTSSLLSLSGYTDPGNRVQITALNQGNSNETTGIVTETGKWSAKIALNKGVTNLRIIVLDAEGRQSLVLRQVSY